MLCGLVAGVAMVTACNEVEPPLTQLEELRLDPLAVTPTELDGDWVITVKFDGEFVDRYDATTQPASGCTWVLDGPDGDTVFSALYVVPDVLCGSAECATGVRDVTCGEFAERPFVRLGSVVELPPVQEPCTASFSGEHPCGADSLILTRGANGLERVEAHGILTCPEHSGVVDRCASVVMERPY